MGVGKLNKRGRRRKTANTKKLLWQSKSNTRKENGMERWMSEFKETETQKFILRKDNK